MQTNLIKYAESMFDANLIRQSYSINYSASFVTESIQYIIRSLKKDNVIDNLEIYELQFRESVKSITVKLY